MATAKEIVAVATSDASFDGRTYSALSRMDRERYCARARLGLEIIDTMRAKSGLVNSASGRFSNIKIAVSDSLHLLLSYRFRLRRFNAKCFSKS
jgi:hypothetical protein